MKKIVFILAIVSVLMSCSEFQKVMKSEEIAPKYALGEKLYNDGKFFKANKLFVQIVPQYRGKPQAEKLMYMYGKTFYEMRDYQISSYQLERFEQAYPNSEKVEEIAFLGAKSYYQLSPVFTKDQADTRQALEKLQIFINNYPESSYLTEANALVKELDYKLESKAFSIAKQYNHISDFKSSIKAFDSFIVDFPGSSYREDALFYRLDAAYKLALNSVESKRLTRLKTADSYLNAFKNKYLETKHSDELSEIEEDLKENLEEYNIKS
jgi:outer membrane protein assembly factor BamD